MNGTGEPPIILEKDESLDRAIGNNLTPNLSTEFLFATYEL
jgi:hypothetical protein